MSCRGGGASELMDKDNRRYPVSFVALESYLKTPRLNLWDRLEGDPCRHCDLFCRAATRSTAAPAAYDKGR